MKMKEEVKSKLLNNRLRKLIISLRNKLNNKELYPNKLKKIIFKYFKKNKHVKH